MRAELQSREAEVRKEEANAAAEAVAMVQQEMEAALFRTAAAHEKSAMCLGEAEAGLARRWARCRWRVPHMHLHIVQVYIVHLHIVHLHIVP